MKALFVKKFGYEVSVVGKNLKTVILSLEAGAKKVEPVKVIRVGVDTVGNSRTSAFVGAENIATIELFACAPWRGYEPELGDYRERYQKAVVAYIARVLLFGLIDEDGEKWVVDHESASGRKDGHAVLVNAKYEDATIHSMGYTREDFGNDTAESALKSISNAWSSQTRISDTFIPVYMRDLLIVESPKPFQFHVRRVSKYDRYGKASEAKWDVCETRPADANGIIFISYVMKHLKGQSKKELLRLFQVRGKSVKGTMAVVDEKMLDSFPYIHTLSHGDVPVEGIADRYAGIITTDMLKSSAWKYQENFLTNLEDDELWICGADEELSSTVRLSRQLFVSCPGVSEAEVRDVASHTVNHVKNMEVPEIEMMKEVLGCGNTWFSRKVEEAQYQSSRNQARFAKLSVSGSFAFIIWELRPLLAYYGCEKGQWNEEKARENAMNAKTLHGSECYFGCGHDFVMAARYPSLKRNFLHMKVIHSGDAEEYCQNVCVLGWDCLANDVLKADTDGDHLQFFYASESEERHVLKTYDFDAMYIPDEDDDVTFEQFEEIQRVERTVSQRTMERLRQENA